MTHMKLIRVGLTLLALSTLLHAGAEGYSEKIQDKIQELRKHTMDNASLIEGSAVGFAGTAGLHSASHAHFMEHATDADLEKMLADKNAAVRIMAAHCVIRQAKNEALLKLVEKLKSDETAIVLMPGGCTASNSTVGAVIKKIAENPDFLL